MAQAGKAMSSTHVTRRAPKAHSDAVQEAKRLEKMQAHSSSHRTSGMALRPAVPAADAAD